MEENLLNDAWVPLLSHLLSRYPSPHSLSSSLTSSSVSHSLTLSILSLVLSFSVSISLFHSSTLSCSLLSPSPQTVTLGFIRSRCWQLREIECNMPRVWEKTGLIVKQIVVRAKALFSADSEHWERHTEFSLGLATFSRLDTVTYQLPLVIVCPAFVYWSVFLLLEMFCFLRSHFRLRNNKSFNCFKRLDMRIFLLFALFGVIFTQESRASLSISSFPVPTSSITVSRVSWQTTPG